MDKKLAGCIQLFSCLIRLILFKVFPSNDAVFKHYFHSFSIENVDYLNTPPPFSRSRPPPPSVTTAASPSPTWKSGSIRNRVSWISSESAFSFLDNLRQCFQNRPEAAATETATGNLKWSEIEQNL
jgi:hypothetical protein